MSYLERIQKHNTDLQAVISKANALPEAGGAETPSQEKYEVISANGIFEIVPDEGYTLSKVIADVIVPIPDGYIKPSGVLDIYENGTYDVTDKASVEVNIPTGGDGAEFARSIINKSITAFVDNEITIVGMYSFVDCAVMTTVNVPNATSIGNYAFSSCDVLSNVIMPKVTSIGQYAFNADTALEHITGESVTSVGSYGFTGCTGLKSVNFPKITTINSYAFTGCTALESFDGANVTSIATYAFQTCSALASVNFPKATSIAAYAFTGTSALKHVAFPALKSMTANAFRGSRFTSCDFPIVTNISNSGFRSQAYLKSVVFPKVASSSTDGMRDCTALTYVDLPSMTSIANGTFNGCTSLVAIILRGTSKVCTLANTGALTSTPIVGGTGYVYVPSALKASYEKATNWTSVSTQFRALEEYTVDGTTTGALDFEKAGIVI